MTAPADDQKVHTSSLIGSAMLVIGLGLSAAFGDFLAITVPVPVGFLIFILVLVILPTGDLMRLASDYIENARPSGGKETDGEKKIDRKP